MTKDSDSVQRVGAFIVDRKDIYQINALLGLCLGYLSGQLDMFNRVMSGTCCTNRPKPPNNQQHLDVKRQEDE